MLFAGIGIGVLALTAWSWAGRSAAARWWTRTTHGDTMILILAPFFGLLMLSLALVDSGAPDWMGPLLFIVSFAILLWSLIVGLISPFNWNAQRAWGPRWYVRRPEKEVYADQRDPLATPRRARRKQPRGAHAERAEGTETNAD